MGSCAHSLRRKLHSRHDILIASAAAEIGGQGLANLLLIGIGVVPEEGNKRGQNAWRAESTLQAMCLVKRFLERVQLVPRESLNRSQVTPVGLHGEHQARSHSRAVHKHGARAAHAMFASDVRTGQLQVVAQEVTQ
jgi:hypothetical protein